MAQLEMFAADPAPGWRPDPDKVRARLSRILAEAREAETLPWEPSRLSLFRTIFPDMTRWLPADEGARWRTDFEAELMRLGVDVGSEEADTRNFERQAG